MEALSGPHRDEFLEVMRNEITELENHGTWPVMRRSEIPSVKQKDGSFKKPPILAGTWAFKVKRFPSGELRKTQATIQFEPQTRFLSLSFIFSGQQV